MLPWREDYKLDTGLLVIECLIRAIEARIPYDPKLPEKDRLALLQQDETEGFILTGVFLRRTEGFREGKQRAAGRFPGLAAQH